MYFPGMKLLSFIDIFMATYQRSPKTETAGPPGERVQPFAIPAQPCRCTWYLKLLLIHFLEKLLNCVSTVRQGVIK